MTRISRRRFMNRVVISSGSVGVLWAGAARAQAQPLGLPIGCQVWPLRSMLGDFPAFAAQLSGIGVTRLELCSPIGYGGEFASLANAKEVKQIMADHGLQSVSSHFSMDELRHSHGKSMEWAQEIGIKQVISATLADGNGGGHPTLDQIKRAAEEYNRIAEATAQAGLQQGLHNEEFEDSMVEGRRTYDRLFELLDADLVRFQFQLSSITDGLVAADYFRKYPGRFFSMHLQDVDMSTAVAASGRDGGERHPQVALGQGSIDWKQTFAAAKMGGVRNYFVEQNWELTQQSVAYLQGLKI